MTTFIAASLAGASTSLICLIVALVLFFIAAFVTPQPGGPLYARLHWGWAGMFFLAISIALGA